MNKPKCYLAGPMATLTYAEATDWRNEAARQLKEVGIAAYSPLRDKPFLKGAAIVSAVGAYDHPLATSRGVITRDHLDCTTADALLVNFTGFDKLSLGTIVEMGWAWDRRIPVVVVAPADNKHVTHPFGAELTSYRVDTLDEGIAIIKSLLLPEAM